MPSIAIPVSLRGQLLNSVRAVTAFSPSTLFALNEPGVWYDPSDVANLAWRRNLLTFTEQFDNAVWAKTAATVTANVDTAPDGTTTADKIIATAVSGNHFVQQSPVMGASPHTVSCYMKAAEYTTGSIFLTQSGNNGAVFTLSGSGSAVASGTGNTASISSVGNGWYRCSVTNNGSADIFDAIRIGPADGAVAIYTGNGTDGILIWGAQLELGSVATDYQRISDVNTEVIERFPSATLYQDTAGTTPVTTPGQTVALALDKSKGLTLGPELVTNGTFDSDTAWTKDTGWTISGGSANTSNVGGTFNNIRQAALTAGRFYQVTFTISNYVSGSCVARLGDTVLGTFTANGTYRAMGFTSGTFANTLYFFAWNGGVFSLDNISVKELPGFHATQATAASRPTYGIVPLGGRRNLLTRTEEIGTSPWGLSRTTVTANAATAPNGTLTADALVETVATGNHDTFIAGGVATSVGQSFTLSAYVKQFGAARRFSLIGFVGAFGSPPANNGASFDLSSQSVISQGANVTSASISSVGNGWYRVVCTMTTVGTGAFDSIFVIEPSNATGRYTSYTGDGTSGILIWGAQLETGSSATAYQRVGSAFDVTEAGVASLSYLSFDGVDDFLITPTITPGIDRAQVFAGVRKLNASSTFSLLAEMSTDAGGNNGALLLSAPGGTSSGTPRAYLGFSRGTGSPGLARTSGATPEAPHTAVVTFTGDISGDRAVLQVNGVLAETQTVDQGTGNFLAYPLYIGRRAGTSAPFNGNLFSLIVRFGTNLDAGTITSTETWVNGKTGAYA